MNFFRARSKTQTPADLVSTCCAQLVKLDSASSRKAALEEVSKQLAQLKVIYYGDAEVAPDPDSTAQLAQQVYLTDLLTLLVRQIGKLEFGARKDACSLFSGLLRRQIGERYVTVDYLAPKEDTMVLLSRAYEQSAVALQTGPMIRECCKHERLARILMRPSGTTKEAELWRYFDYVENNTFDIASDAFSTLRDLLTRHRDLAAAFMLDNFDPFFKAYLGFLQSDNYVWRRQSLKLLGELLLERSNFDVMHRYVLDPANLRLMMNLLKDRSQHIQFEAFQVFKVFVANPHKSQGVRDILVKNKDRLLEYLGNFQKGKDDDEQFADEKRFIMDTISGLD
ncbi:Hym1p [Savitreella phatthalungensis]